MVLLLISPICFDFNERNVFVVCASPGDELTCGLSGGVSNLAAKLFFEAKFSGSGYYVRVRGRKIHYVCICMYDNM